MHQTIQLKTTVSPIRNSVRYSPLRRVFLLVPLTLALFALAPASRAVFPAPDGGYPGSNTAEGANALQSLTAGSSNTATGASALFSDITGSLNTATGAGALFSNKFGTFNVADGLEAAFHNTGSANTATGFQALFSDTTGGANTADGFQALFHNTGANNIGLGTGAGFLLTTGNNNIDVGHNGVAADNNTIRIGTKGTQMKTFIAGISGVEVTGDSVCVNSDGQLGVCPMAVSNDAKGKVYIARYEAVIRQLQKQQKQIEKLTAKLKEQAAQIQKVNAQIEASKPATQTVVSSQ
jgi:hypothetical protein